MLLEGATVGRLDDDWSSERPNGYWQTSHGFALMASATAGSAGSSRPQWSSGWGGSAASISHSGSVGQTSPPSRMSSWRPSTGWPGRTPKTRKVAITETRRPAKVREPQPVPQIRQLVSGLEHQIRLPDVAGRRGPGRRLPGLRSFVLLRPASPSDGAAQTLRACTRCHPLPSAPAITGAFTRSVTPSIRSFRSSTSTRPSTRGPYGQVPWGRAWFAGTWIATGLGWALATLLVAGYTGLVRRD